MDDETIETDSHALAQVARTLEKYGRTANGVAWSDRLGQFGRFETLTSQIDRTMPLTVNDIGCGYGPLFGYLAAGFQLVDYCGSDICETMIKAASAEVTDRRARFILSARPVTVADGSITSGTVNMSAGADDTVWRRLTEDVLRAMAGHSRVGFALNMLRPQYRDDFLWRAEPEPWLRFCHDQLAGKPTLIKSPDGDEWSLVVLRSL